MSNLFTKAMTTLRARLTNPREFYAEYVDGLRKGALVDERKRVIAVYDELLAIVDREIAKNPTPSHPSQSAPDP